MFVPGGTFVLGNANLPDAQPLQTEAVTSFFLDQTEVTGAAYQACIQSKQCETPAGGVKDHPFFNYDLGQGIVVSGKELHPINGVTFTEAKQYCQAQGKRLPTEIEWEYAARGTADSMYPWGNTAADSNRACLTKTSGTCAVKQYGSTLLGMEQSQLDKQGLVGAYDLAGNVDEWTDTQYSDKLAPTNQPCTNTCVMRGGSWISDAGSLRSFVRRSGSSINGYVYVGFRCAKDL